MIILILFAFLAGIVTVLSPCILPVLPIVLSSSVGGGHKRPLGVMSGFILSFTFFTLFLSTIVQATGISANILRNVSVFIIFFFGLSLLVPLTQVLLEKMFSSFSNLMPQNTGSGFGSGLLVGLSLGLLWTPCVGPILAAVISLAITGTVTGSAAIITLAYALGTAIPMTAIIYGGRNLLLKTPWLTAHTAAIQKGFGIIMMMTAIGIFFNVDRTFQTWILRTFPNYGVGLTKIEEIDIVKKSLDTLNPMSDKVEMGKPMFELTDDGKMMLPILFNAPELIPGGEWFNSEPLTLEELKGKVVLIDFWTYSCINCIRTLPYLKDWYKKYEDKGLVIIGVHSPEFEFEKSAKNVAQAISDFEIEYPVVQDNDFATWRAYENRYWPAKYLIDREGRVRYTHFGEGEYTKTENNIRLLLDEEPIMESTQLTTPIRFPRYQTPETYLGYGRAQSYMQSTQLEIDKVTTNQFPPTVVEDAVALEGDWLLTEEYIEATSDAAKLKINFDAGQVYLVLELAEDQKSGQVHVSLDDQALPPEYKPADVDQLGFINIDQAQKYDLVNLHADAGRHTLTLTFTKGVRAFAFTFGRE